MPAPDEVLAANAARFERLSDALCSITTVRRYGRQLFDLGTSTLRHHRPDQDGDCGSHFTSQEELHTWPCDQVTDLAHVLDVKL